MAQDQRKISRGTCKCLVALVVVAAALVLEYFDVLPKMSLSPVSRMAQHNCFLYFAYGSNLLKERIHINNPSAKMISVGKVKVQCFFCLNYFVTEKLYQFTL